MARSTSRWEWVNRNPVVATGAFMSTVFLIAGLGASAAFMPNAVTWQAAKAWPSTEAEITGSRLAYSIRGRTARPDFTFRYQWKGREYTSSGYDLLNVYTSDLAASRAVLNAHPVGSRVSVRVNPEHADQAVLTRGSVWLLSLYAVGPFFMVLGAIGGFFSFAAWRGWLDSGSRHPVGRAIHAMGGMLLRENVLKTVFFVVVGGVIIGMIVGGIRANNWLVVGVAVFMIWGVWNAARKRS